MIKSKSKNKNCVKNLDCTVGMQSIKSSSVPLVFADPPYNIGYKYDIYDDQRSHARYMADADEWGREIYRILRPNGTFWLAIGDEYAADLKVLFNRDIGFSLRSWVVWYFTFGVNCVNKFTRSHTHFFYFVKNPENFVFNRDALRVPSARQLVYMDKRAKDGGRLPDDTWILRPHDCDGGFPEWCDMWALSRIAGTFKQRANFPCQMPEQILGRIIRACSNPGDLVVDPFIGSGSTMVVAKKLRRAWLGFDISHDYIMQAEERIAAVKPGDPLEGRSHYATAMK